MGIRYILGKLWESNLFVVSNGTHSSGVVTPSKQKEEVASKTDHAAEAQTILGDKCCPVDHQDVG